jgi:DNA polymerase
VIAIMVAGYDDWRSRARALLQSEVAPDHIDWQDGASPQEGLFGQAEQESMAIAATAKVPRSFLALAKNVACNRDPGRWAMLYRLLWRVTHENHELLKVSVDDDVLRAERMK